HSAHIDARLTDEEPTELDDELRLGQLFTELRDYRGQGLSDRPEIESLFAGKIRDAEAAAHVQQTHGGRREPSELEGQRGSLALSVYQCLGAQVLRAAENVEAAKLHRRFADPAEHVRHDLGIDAELLRAAAHFHSGRLELEVRVHAHGHARTCSGRLRDSAEYVELALGLYV